MTPTGLKLPDLDSPYGRIMATVFANPDVWLTQRQIFELICEAYGVDRLSYGNLSRLTANGYLERRGERLSLEYRATGKLPSLKGKRDLTPEQQRASQEVRAEEKRRADGLRLAETRAIMRRDWAKITEVLTEHPGISEAKLTRLSGIPLGRLRYACKGMADIGRLMRTGGKSDGNSGTARSSFALLQPKLPCVSLPRLTHDAQTVLDHLSVRPSDSELGLSDALRWTRERVCLSLAHLSGLGLVDWGGVGHLVLWRVAAADEASDNVALDAALDAA